MTRLFDGSSFVDITMVTWKPDYTGRSQDLSNDFFGVGGLPFDRDYDAYKVQDVEYCIDQAKDWEKGEGDFYDPNLTDEEISRRQVLVVGMLDVMPSDKMFFTGLVQELCHATGYEVLIDGQWWNEYEDTDGALHYGR